MNSFYNDILNHENTYKQTFYIKYLTEFMILGFNKKLFNKNLIFLWQLTRLLKNGTIEQ